MEEPTKPEGDQMPEEALSIEEKTREEVERGLRLMSNGDKDSALPLFKELRLVDQG